MHLLVILCSLVFPVKSLKVLLYQPAYGHSHMQFSGALVDILTDAGHEVHMLIPEWNPDTRSNGTTRAASYRRIKSASNSAAFAQLDHLKDPYRMTVWRFLLKSDQLRAIMKLSGEFCRLMVNDEELLGWLRNGRFDAALCSMYDMCAHGLFHVANIKPVMGFLATPAASSVFVMFGISSPSSFTQDVMFPSGGGDIMNYWQRAKNFFIQCLLDYVTTPWIEAVQQKVFTDKFGSDFPPLRSLVANSSYLFINSNELFELPRLISHKIIYIGGIALPKPKKLNEEYSKLFAQYSGVILFSFGSLARTSLMPSQMRTAFVDAFAKFPNILFIWKVDRGTANDTIYRNASNVHAVEWMPQNDLLSSGRLSAFVTHAGLNSLSEAVFAGVPVIAIPLFSDQMHNAALVQKRHIGYVISKWNVTVNSVLDALNAVLYDTSYLEKSKELSKMLKKKPLKPHETFLRYFEFASEFKSVGEHLQLQSINLNDIQLHSIDIVIPFVFCSMLSLYFAFLIIRLFVRRMIKRWHKTKND